MIAASGRYDNKMPAQHSVYKLAIIESIVNPLYSTRVYTLELTVPLPYTHNFKKQMVCKVFKISIVQPNNQITNKQNTCSRSRL